MSRLNIVYVVNTMYPYYDGGYERRFFELAKRLVMRGCSVTVFTSAPRITHHNGIDFINVYYEKSFFTKQGFRSMGKEARFSIKLFERLIEYKWLLREADIVEVNQTPPFHIFPVKAVKSIVGSNPVAMTIHEDLVDYFKDYWRSRLHRWSSFKLHEALGLVSKSLYLNALKCANYYISPSKPTLKSLVQHGVDVDRVFYIPNGINMEVKKYRSIPLCRDKIYISFMGRLVPEKRPEWLIYALKDIVKHNPSLLNRLEVNIIGKGPLTPFLSSLIESYGLSRVVKMRGYVPDDEKFKLLAKSDIFCLPSRREGFSLALLEAMFLGAAPIVTVDLDRIGISGVLELVSHLRNGYVTYSFNEFKNGLHKLIVDEDLRSKLRGNAMKTAERYDWNSIVVLAETIYRRISSLANNTVLK